jgi:hypothetical protein
VKRSPKLGAGKSIGTDPAHPSENRTRTVERVQTGLRIEKKMLKVLKAMAEYHDISLGDLVEGIVLHAFEGKPVFSDQSLKQIQALKRVYGLELDATASHKLVESS